MTWGEIWAEVLALARSIMNWVFNALWWFMGLLQYVYNILLSVALYIWNGVRYLAHLTWRGLEALRHLNFRSIWNALKRGYNRLRWALDWYQRRILGPIDRIRRQIWDIYRRFFKPIIQLIDSFRVMVRFIAIFNRRLAARLDAALFRLESKIMWPITAALQRLNEISSYVHAIITAMGYLDRVLFLETLRRDASLAWEVLTNPRGRIFTRPTPPATRTRDDIRRDFALFLDADAGPYAELAQRVFQDFPLYLEGG